MKKKNDTDNNDDNDVLDITRKFLQFNNNNDAKASRRINIRIRVYTCSMQLLSSRWIYGRLVDVMNATAML